MNNSIENIKHIIKSYNYSRPQFCKITNIKLDTLKGILDKGNIPSLDTLMKIKESLNVSIDDLIYKDLSKTE